jgi:endonuclease-3 related protein
LKAVVEWWLGHDPAATTDVLRAQLLATYGVGPETADSILLYALNRPSFVVDAYTKRILTRHGLAAEDVDYAGMKRLFEAELPEDVGLYNEFHALIVEAGKRHCGTTAKCEGCPLEADHAEAAAKAGKEEPPGPGGPGGSDSYRLRPAPARARRRRASR